MIRALFVGAQDYGKRRKSNTLPSGIDDMGEAISAALAAAGNGLMSAGVATGLIEDVRARLGFTIAVPSPDALAPPGRIARKSVVQGKSVSVVGDFGGTRTY